MKTQRGFTLLELLATLVIVAILLIVGIAVYSNFIERAKIAHAIGDIGEIHLKAEMFDLNNNRYPANLAEIGMDGLLDPWGNPYQFLVIDGLGNNGAVRKNRNMVPVNLMYDIYSMGPDGVTATPFTSTLGKDDVVMAGDGTYFGLAETY